MAAETVQASDVVELPRGSHVCWIVADPDAFDPVAAAIVADAAETGEKTFAFGPESSPSRRSLEALGAIGLDPFVDLLSGRALEPQTMYSMFARQCETARAGGYAGVRVIAEMDWLLPSGATTDDVVSFELGLDRVLHGLGATVVCAYRSPPFEHLATDAFAEVHPTVWGAEPMFQLVASGDGEWRLSGDVDFSVAARFGAAMSAVASASPAAVDLGGLRFIDCAGMRALARAVASAMAPLRFRSIPSSLRRFWALVGLDEISPLEDAAAGRHICGSST